MECTCASNIPASLTQEEGMEEPAHPDRREEVQEGRVTSQARRSTLMMELC